MENTMKKRQSPYTVLVKMRKGGAVTYLFPGAG